MDVSAAAERVETAAIGDRRTSIETPAAIASTGAAGSGLGYQPALDGVRAVAVVLVLLFHGGFGWASGGYVGVSVFFTLSGFLITSLALHEWERTGRIDVVAFYGRRVRRLLPASLLCLGGVMVAAIAGRFEQLTDLRRDLWAALAQVYNWVTLATGGDYARQMARVAGQRAPLDHYWSLAIEEQFYWLWPLVLLVVLRGSRTQRLAAVAALTAGFTFAAVVTARTAGPAAAYLATQARLPEILTGALLAVVCVRPRENGAGRVAGLVSRGGVLAAAGLAVVAVAAVTWPADGGPARQGWLPAFSMASVAVIAGLQGPSPVRSALSWPPLVALGRISYGVYLFHWPIFTLVDERTVDAGRPVLFVIRTAVTLVVAAASYRVIEQPIRLAGRHRAGAARHRWTFGGAGAACLAVGLVITTVPDRRASFVTVTDEVIAAVALQPISSDARLPAVPRRAVRVLVVGDSTAVALSSGMVRFAYDHPGTMQVSSAAAPSCGLDMSGEVVPPNELRDECLQVHLGLADAVRRLRPDVVVAMVTMSDLQDRRWSEEEGTLAITDPRFAERLDEAYALVTTSFLEAGAGDVVWLVPPIPRIYATGESAWAVDPERFAAYRAVLERLDERSDRVTVGDVAAWIDDTGDQPDTDDGLHWSLEGAVRVTADFVYPLVRTVAEG